MATKRPIIRYADTGRYEELRVGDTLAGSGGGGNPTTGVAESFETVNRNLSSDNAVYTYTPSGDLQTVSYASGIVKTLSYTSGSLISVALSGNTPNGIELTKSFSYTSGNLTGVTYT